MQILQSTAPTWLILGMALVPVLAWLAIFYRRDALREPVRLLKWTFALGMVSTVPLLVYRWLAGAHSDIDILARFRALTGREWLAALLFFLVVAIVEEYLKHVAMLIVVERNRREFTQVIDGIIYGVTAALGFAFIENMVYLGEAERSVLALVFVARALGATFGHALFSGVFGYFYAQARFTPHAVRATKNPILRFHQELGMGLGLHIIRTHLIPRRGVMDKTHTRGQLLAEGYWIAVLLHLLYDLLAVSLSFLMYDLSWLIAPFLMFGGGWLFHRFAMPENQQERKRLTNILTFPEYLLPTERARKVRRKLGLSSGL